MIRQNRAGIGPMLSASDRYRSGSGKLSDYDTVKKGWQGVKLSDKLNQPLSQERAP